MVNCAVHKIVNDSQKVGNVSDKQIRQSDFVVIGSLNYYKLTVYTCST